MDASFAPPHEGYKSVQGIVICRGSHVLHWASGKQPFITMSTAESELVGYGEGYQCGETICELLKVIGLKPKKILRGDSKAGISQLNTDAGAWRTRRLRLRAWKLREAVQLENADWTVEHCPGSELSADGFTKSLQSQAFRRFRGFLNMRIIDELKAEKLTVKALHRGGDLWQGCKATLQGRGDLWHECGTALLGSGVALLELSGKRWLGALMIAVAGLVTVVDQDPQGKKKDQDPQGKKKNEDPEKRREKDPLGDQEPEGQTCQDPLRTKQEREKCRTRNQDAEGTSRKLSMVRYVSEDQPKCWQPKRLESEGGSGGRIPGLPAMRIDRKDLKGSSGERAMDVLLEFGVATLEKQRRLKVTQGLEGQSSFRIWAEGKKKQRENKMKEWMLIGDFKQRPRVNRRLMSRLII